MLRAVVLVCVVASGLAMGPKTMMDFFQKMSVLKECYGEAAIKQYYAGFKGAVAKCSGEEISTTDMPAFRQYIAQLRRVGGRPNMVPVPMPFFMNQQGFPAMFQQQMQRQMQQQPQFPFASRNKRSLDLSPENIARAQDNLMAKLSNLTCIFQTLEYMTEDKQVNLDKMTQEISGMEIDNNLKADLLENIASCNDFAKCMPFEENPIKKEYGPFMAFMKCFKKKEMMCCMKNSFRQYAADMDMEIPDDEMMMFAVAAESSSEIENFIMDIFMD